MVSNQPPSAKGSIPAAPPLDAGGAAHSVDAAVYFGDPDGDPLTYQARSSKETVATVSTAASTVSVTPRAKGTATITSYQGDTRDVCAAPKEPCPKVYEDSIIQEVTPAGTQGFQWNSWNNMTLEDCAVYGTDYLADYAHLNSLQIVDGGIVASFRHCNQILRIDGSTGAVEWKLGGSASTPDQNTVFLEMTGDRWGEFCGQHSATLTAVGTVVLFDNGVRCKGTRKIQAPFTRVVEYDISSGSRAVYKREFRMPPGQGYADIAGGVVVLENGHWLISWGATRHDVTVAPAKTIAVSEIDPATGRALFHMNNSHRRASGGTHRVYREREAAVQIPLNLP